MMKPLVALVVVVAAAFADGPGRIESVYPPAKWNSQQIPMRRTGSGLGR